MVGFELEAARGDEVTQGSHTGEKSLLNLGLLASPLLGGDINGV